MKTLLDFLRENNGQYICYIGRHHITFDLCNDGLSMDVDRENYKINLTCAKWGLQDSVQDILYNLDKTEIRFCEECGRPYDCGFIAGDGEWYCCEPCFDAVMDRDYGKGKWRDTEEEGCYGGFYEFLDDSGEWDDTGIYYTEWND